MHEGQPRLFVGQETLHFLWPYAPVPFQFVASEDSLLLDCLSVAQNVHPFSKRPGYQPILFELLSPSKLLAHGRAVEPELDAARVIDDPGETLEVSVLQAAFDYVEYFVVLGAEVRRAVMIDLVAFELDDACHPVQIRIDLLEVYPHSGFRLFQLV